ncbi:hypothetical protein MKW94_030070 [Papaver nudicaule]|uniref:cyclin-dependent kinase n=1 Tax=Papaver nudicaule TaxID=74823 RepID=A0AA41W204_PAPNU|nr:hypothetical protein [Papaver nudicaule]
MAAGRHGGYRDNEFRDRESDLKIGGKRQFVTCTGEGYDRDQRRRSQIGGERDRNYVNSRVINGQIGGERERVSTNSSNLGMNGKIRVLENGGFDEGVGVKRRKFSPILWDKEEKKEKEVSNSIKTRAVLKNPVSPLKKSGDREEKEVSNLMERRAVSKNSRGSPPSVKSKEVTLERVSQESSIKVKSREITLERVSQESSNKVSRFHANSVVPTYSVGSVVKETQSRSYCSSAQVQLKETQSTSYCSSAQAQLRSDDCEPGEIEEEEFVPRNISVSRWAEVRSSPGGKDSTPEVGEFIREGSGAKSSVSFGDECLVGSVSSGDNSDHMSKDGINNDESGSYSDTNSDGGNYKGTRQKKSINMLEGCRSVREFERLNRIDEGTYGVVFRARDKKTGEVVALKKVKMEKEKEGFPMTALREINILLSTDHPSIVEVKEVVMDDLDSIFMVMEYMEHDLKSIMETKRQPFSQSEVKCLMLQLLEGVEYLHDNWVLHRDLKTSNILMNNQGELKICDFGMSRLYGSPLKRYTQLVVTLWYRAPELLLGAKQYSTAIDMWSLGCIMAELLSKEPLFNGKTEVDQLDKIFETLGTPSETSWPGFSKLPDAPKVKFSKHHQFSLRKKFPPTAFTESPVLSDAGFDLLNRLLAYDPAERITAKEAVNHEWFREVPLPMSRDLMPTFPAQHAQDRRVRRVMKSPDPLEEQRRRELQQESLGTSGLFGSEL